MRSTNFILIKLQRIRFWTPKNVFFKKKSRSLGC